MLFQSLKLVSCRFLLFIFLIDVFEKLSYTKASFLWLEIQYNTYVMKYYYNKNEFCIFIYLKHFIYSCDGKADISAAIAPVFSVTWSFRNQSNLLQKHLINVEDSSAFFHSLRKNNSFYLK